MKYLLILLSLSFIVGCGTQKRAKSTSQPETTKKTEQTTTIVTEKIPARDIEVITAPDFPKEEKIKKSEEEFCARNTKMPGYRIQIYFSKDRKNWQPTENSFRANHPNVDVMLKYSPPHYRILVGQYLTKNSAKLDLIKYKRDYPNAVIANWDIWCKQAK